MLCRECQIHLEADVRFCPRCGTQLQGEVLEFTDVAGNRVIEDERGRRQIVEPASARRRGRPALAVALGAVAIAIVCAAVGFFRSQAKARDQEQVRAGQARLEEARAQLRSATASRDEAMRKFREMSEKHAADRDKKPVDNSAK